MDLAVVVLNIAYAIYMSSSLFKDIVGLRVTLILTSIAFVAYGIVDDSLSIILWNIGFGLAHSIQLARHFNDRRQVQLSDESRRFQESLFPELDDYDFFVLWSLGQDQAFSDSVLIEEHAKVDVLMLLRSGSVTVERSGQFISTLGPGQLVGEMSFVTGNTAAGTVRAVGAVQVRAWPQSQLRALELLNPSAHSAIQQAIGRSLTRKVG